MTQIGTSVLDVPPIALGANTFGWTATAEVSHAILDAFTAGGGSLVDTADAYSAWAPGNHGGESETIIGGWLTAGGARERLVISTKVSRHPDFKGLSATNIAAAAKASLRRLQTDTIDIYFAHYDDPDTELAESISAFAELVAAGSVRYLGLSNFTPARIVQWLQVSDRLGAPAPVVLQPHYNLLVREPFESELRPLAQLHQLGVIPYYSLAAGFLTGKYRSADDARGVAREGMVSHYLTESGFAVAARVVQIAEFHGVAPAAVALAWLIAQPGVTAPIAGATSVEQVQPLLDATRLTLSESELTELDTVSRAFVAA